MKEAYSTAIKLDPQDNLSLCNRAAAYLEIDDAANALADATRSATLSPQFVKVCKCVAFFMTNLGSC